MKKLVLIVSLFCAVSTFAQTADEMKQAPPKHEVKGNALFLVFGIFEAGYERLLNEESGIGIVGTVPLRSDVDLNYAIEGYYRYYFGEKYAAGFFAEGFAMLNNSRDEYTIPFSWAVQTKTYTDLAMGIGIGGKWVSKRGVLLELNVGFGRQLFHGSERSTEFIGKGGITVGYRF